MSRPTRVLFVGHDAYPAGATIFLLNMLRWMRERTDLQFDLALRTDGEMVPEFARICRTFVLAPSRPPERAAARVHAWWTRWRPYRRRRTLRSLADSGDYDVLYFNTLTLGQHLAAVEHSPLPVITHAHELDYIIRRYAEGEEQRVLRRSDRLVCVSDAVRETLVREFSCAHEKVRRVHGFTSVDVQPHGSEQERRASLLDPLGIRRDALLVGVCAHGTLVKGVDLAIPLARLLPARVGGRELHLVWVGSERPDYPWELARSDARKAGVAQRVHFAGMTRTPADWMSLFDVHLMLSREDPFPLVVMEAAALGVPTVAFAGAGGATEFIGLDAGRSAPFLDLPAMAQTLVGVLEDDTARRRMGEAARARVRQHHAPDIVLPEIVRVIQEVAGAHVHAG